MEIKYWYKTVKIILKLVLIEKKKFLTILLKKLILIWT